MHPVSAAELLRAFVSRQNEGGGRPLTCLFAENAEVRIAGLGPFVGPLKIGRAFRLNGPMWSLRLVDCQETEPGHASGRCAWLDRFQSKIPRAGRLELHAQEGVIVRLDVYPD